MPTLRKRINPWHARAKRDGIEYSLGYFKTEQEAKEREDKWNEIYPRKKNQHQ